MTMGKTLVTPIGEFAVQTERVLGKEVEAYLVLGIWMR